ncbi:hypothetical protein [Bacillus bombysepticus]|uniref:hypothetical protein n=1 Tax=Bacillus bombysepticus TaxID=658666 RepID=UPI00301A8110
MSKKDKYQWTTSIFHYLGKAGEWTTGYFETKKEAIDDLVREGISGFIVLENPEIEGDIQDIEFIGIAKDSVGNVVVSQMVGCEQAEALYWEEVFDIWKKDFEVFS